MKGLMGFYTKSMERDPHPDTPWQLFGMLRKPCRYLHKKRGAAVGTISDGRLENMQLFKVMSSH